MRSSIRKANSGQNMERKRYCGEAMILRHEKHKSLRFFMRQEDTLKVMANHVIDPLICLQPNSGSDESYVWSAYDFTSGELVVTVFALVLENSLTATIFRNKFVYARFTQGKLWSG
jgi:Ran-binding protein 1